MRCLLLIMILAGTASAQPAPNVLPSGIFTLTVTAEVEASKGTFGDPTSIAPDAAIGVTNELTLAVLHSSFGRTGFRGGAGDGICITDACGEVYDNASAEVYYNLADGAFALAANGGFHATSFDAGHYAAKAGARIRLTAGQVSLVSLPSILIGVSERDANPDRLFLPFNASLPVTRQLAVGLITGFKSPLDDLENSYELAAGAFVSYVASPSVAFAVSWVHGNAIGGGDNDGLDGRALQIWVTITRSTYTRYR